MEKDDEPFEMTENLLIAAALKSFLSQEGDQRGFLPAALDDGPPLAAGLPYPKWPKLQKKVGADPATGFPASRLERTGSAEYRQASPPDNPPPPRPHRKNGYNRRFHNTAHLQAAQSRIRYNTAGG